jgi:hypothetical protein
MPSEIPSVASNAGKPLLSLRSPFDLMVNLPDHSEWLCWEAAANASLSVEFPDLGKYREFAVETPLPDACTH